MDDADPAIHGSTAVAPASEFAKISPFEKVYTHIVNVTPIAVGSCTAIQNPAVAIACKSAPMSKTLLIPIRRTRRLARYQEITNCMLMVPRITLNCQGANPISSINTAGPLARNPK